MRNFILLLLLIAYYTSYSQTVPVANFLTFKKDYKGGKGAKSSITVNGSILYRIEADKLKIFNINESFFGDANEIIPLKVDGEVGLFEFNENTLFINTHRFDEFGNSKIHIYTYNLTKKNSELYYDYSGVYNLLISEKMLNKKEIPNSLDITTSYIMVGFDNGTKIIFEKVNRSLLAVYLPTYENGTVAIFNNKKGTVNYKKISWETTPFFQELQNIEGNDSNKYGDMTFAVNKGNLVLSKAKEVIAEFKLPNTNERCESLYISNDNLFINTYYGVIAYSIDKKILEKIADPNTQLKNEFQYNTDFQISDFDNENILISHANKLSSFNTRTGVENILFDNFPNIRSLAFDKKSGILGISNSDFDIYFINLKNKEKNIEGNNFNYQHKWKLNKYGLEKFNIWDNFSGITTYFKDGEKKDIPFKPEAKSGFDDDRRLIPPIIGKTTIIPSFPHETKNINDSVKVEFFQYHLSDSFYSGFVVICKGIIIETFGLKSHDLVNAVIKNETNKIIVQYSGRLIKVYSLDSLITNMSSIYRDSELNIKQNYQNYIRNYNCTIQDKMVFTRSGNLITQIAMKPHDSYSYKFINGFFENDFKVNEVRLSDEGNSFIYYSDDQFIVVSPNTDKIATFLSDEFSPISSSSLGLSGLNNTSSSSAVKKNSYGNETTKCQACFGTGKTPIVNEPGVGRVGGLQCPICLGKGVIKVELQSVEREDTRYGNWLLNKNNIYYSKSLNSIYIQLNRKVSKYHIINSNDARVTGNYLSTKKEDLLSTKDQIVFYKLSLKDKSGELIATPNLTELTRVKLNGYDGIISKNFL